MKKTNLSDYDPNQVPSGKEYRIGIAVAEWNKEITDALAAGALETLRKYDVAEELDAVICIGCVIQGETRHFDFICEAVSQGITNVALKHGKPVIFSLLTTNNTEQAQDRAGGKHGNKGVEGAVTALKMIALQRQLENK